MNTETRKINLDSDTLDSLTCIYAEYKDGEIIRLWDYLPVCIGKEKPLTNRELAQALEHIAKQGHAKIVECMFQLQSKRSIYPSVDMFFKNYTEQVLKVELGKFDEEKQISMLKALSSGSFDGCEISIKNTLFNAETIYGVLTELVL